MATARTLRDEELIPKGKNLRGAASGTVSLQREKQGQHGLGRLPVATL